MSQEESTTTAGPQGLDRLRKQQLQALHELLVRELHRQEEAAAPTRPRAEKPASVGAALVVLALLAAVPHFAGMAIWGSIYDEPGWWDVGSAILIIVGILGVVDTLRNRTSA